MTEIGGQLCSQAVNRGSDLSATVIDEAKLSLLLEMFSKNTDI